jgi:4-hydroxy-tetrahydrodipicolinate synthase
MLQDPQEEVGLPVISAGTFELVPRYPQQAPPPIQRGSGMSNTPRLEGILAALITPFTGDGSSIDEAALRSLVSRLVAAGVGGLISCGSTGEFAALSVQERKRVTEVVVGAAAHAVPVVAHTGALTTRETIELSEHAAGVGATAVMVVPPFYEPPGWAELLDHYVAVARAIEIPLVIYSIPSASGVRMSAEQIAELAAIPGVDFIKDSSGDAVLLTQLLQEYSDRLGIFNGLDSLTFYALAAGARGAVWGAANFIPELTLELYRVLAVEKDLDAARSVWAKIWPICHILDSTNYAAAVKTACALLGIPAGPPRAPLRLLAGDARKRLAVAIENAGLALA